MLKFLKPHKSSISYIGKLEPSSSETPRETGERGEKATEVHGERATKAAKCVRFCQEKRQMGDQQNQTVEDKEVNTDKVSDMAYITDIPGMERTILW